MKQANSFAIAIYYTGSLPILDRCCSLLFVIVVVASFAVAVVIDDVDTSVRSDLFVILFVLVVVFFGSWSLV